MADGYLNLGEFEVHDQTFEARFFPKSSTMWAGYNTSGGSFILVAAWPVTATGEPTVIGGHEPNVVEGIIQRAATPLVTKALAARVAAG